MRPVTGLSIGAVVLAILGGIGAGCGASGGDDNAPGYRETRRAKAEDYELTLDSCATNTRGFGNAEGTIVNTSDETLSFEITATITSGSTLLANGFDVTGPLEPGDRARWHAGGLLLEDTTDITCRTRVVIEV
jgi:hypothetical protein